MRPSPRIAIPVLFAVACAGALTAGLGWQVSRTRALLSEHIGAVPLQEGQTGALPDDAGLGLLGRQDAVTAIRAGDLAALDGSWTDAERLYQQAVDARGGVPALRKLAQAQIQRREYTEAKRTIEQLQRKGVRAEDILLLNVSIGLRTGELAATRTQLNAADDSPHRSYGLALLDVLQGNHDSAQAELQAVENGWEPSLRAAARTIHAAYEEYSLFPDSPNIHLITLLARAFAQVQECELALPLLQQVTQQEDDYRDAWMVQGYCELTTERTAEALASFEKAYAIDPEKPEIQYFLGRTFALRDDHANALTFLEYALKNGFTPESEVRLLIAREAMATGDAPLAMEQFDTLLAGDAASLDIAEEAVHTALQANLLEEAYVIAKSTATRWPDDAASWTVLATAAERAGHAEEAAQARQHATELGR